jgi:outer membrane immunogenic protein
MNKLLLSVSLVALSSAAALAADLPMQTKAPYVAAPAFSWTGCYVGVHGGGGTMTGNTEGSNQGANGSGAVAGGQAGCNYQEGNWVFGGEGEGYWSNIKSTNGNSEVPNILNPGDFGFFSTTARNKNDFTIAARVGIAFDRTLIYGKGGWAWGSFDFSETDSCCGPGPGPFTYTSNGYLNGFLAGVGIEHALTRNWTVKLEYNYIGFGSKLMTVNECVPGTCVVEGTTTNSATKQIFKVGVNYLFDIGGAPVVAKY